MDEIVDYNNLQFHEKLGEGGGGTVNRVTFNTPFKGYTEAAAKSVWELPKAEVEIMCKLQHPNIVPMLGFYKNGPINVILLEYAPNGSLHDYLKDPSKPLSQQLTHKWLREVADALEYLHDQHVLHRDIKAQNCLLFDDNVLKLCDFGIAREIDRSQTTSEQKGTHRYMAPEILRGNEQGRGIYSKPSDIYAYGMLTLEIVTRKPPFEGMEWQTVMFSVCGGGRPKIPPECPDHLSHIIQHCWRDDPKRRPTIEDIKEELHKPSEITTTRYTRRPMWITTPFFTDTAYTRVQCCPNGNMVVCGQIPYQLHMLNSDGEHITQLTTKAQGKLGVVQDIAVSSQGYIVAISLYSRFVHVFNSNGTYLHYFSILAAAENFNTKVNPRCVTLDRDGHVLVGDYVRELITIHTCPEGKLVKRIQCCFLGMAVNSKNKIVHTLKCESPSWMCNAVAVIDNAGNKVLRFTPTIHVDAIPGEMSGDKIVARCIVCDPLDRIYVAMCIYKKGTCRLIPNTGHLHQYSRTGAFMRCIDRGIFMPLDLAIASDGTSLIIANGDSILIYKVSQYTNLQIGLHVEEL
ncbi:uncharacterized protein [Amphiura filiformis]|uniref:uncharacterized protein n=1 Tax=Amphiura filiformis TaxID=82378 RepID=UPI003B2280B6